MKAEKAAHPITPGMHLGGMVSDTVAEQSPLKRYEPPVVAVVVYAAEGGYATSVEEEGNGFVRDENPARLVLLNSQGRTNQNERYEDINWNGFGGDDGFWPE